MRIVITGANRGIGLEMARQLLARGEEVVAAVRAPAKAPELQALVEQYPQRLRVLACDVASDQSVRKLAREVEFPVDILINNAGVMGSGGSVEQLDFEAALRTFSINALGPLRVTAALLSQLRAGAGKKVLHLTSGMGSIGDNSSGGYYAYRMSKAALNMASRSLSVDLKADGIASAVINPGWVKTDMGGAHAPTPVEESVRGILEQLDGLSLANSGAFLDHSGKRWEW